MQVKLTYFRNTGKWYSEGIADVPEIYTLHHEVIDHVRNLQKTGNLPGLVENGGKGLIILITFEELENRLPGGQTLYGIPHLIPALETD